ncbi:MAG: ABC transporter substrate-binding protein [Bacteroidales bacterium]
MKLLRFPMLTVILVIFLLGCKNNISEENNLKFETKYAKGFVIYDADSIYNVIIRDPADTAKLLSKITLPKKELNNKNKIACFSTTHIAFMEKVGFIDKIIGIPDINYYKDADILNRMNLDNVEQITLGVNAKNEIIINLSPDFITITGFEYQNNNGLAAAGLKIIPIVEYLEQTALGRAEWIKIFGLLLGEYKKASDVFNEIEHNYLTLIEKYSLEVDENATICDFMEYQGYWYSSGGQSYIANLYKDAGFNYIYKDNENSGSFSVDLETAITKGSETEYWRVMTSSPHKVKLSDITSQNDYYQYFKAVKNNKIIYCNTSKSPYYIEDVVEPEIILQDLINARLHKNIGEGKYYNLIEMFGMASHD